MIVAEYIKTLQSYEEYAFSWEEVLEKCNAPESTIRKELVRLAKKNEIVNLRKGFYSDLTKSMPSGTVFDGEKVLNDYIFLTFLVGNDFVLSMHFLKR